MMLNNANQPAAREPGAKTPDEPDRQTADMAAAPAPLSFPQRLVNALRRRLAPFPRLYALASRIYQRIGRRFGRMAVLPPAGFGPSRPHLSATQGLTQVTATPDGDLATPARPFQAHYEGPLDFSGYATDIKAIAYHLPQFHAIPENDAWWGQGFTEWHNTRKAGPLFPGHYQPREPHDDIGYYDLSDPAVLRRQVDMAKSHGIYGFCFYHYWFHGRRLLGKPVDLLLNTPDLDMPFCLCWANETWSKKWDGRDHHILMKQTFSPEDDLRFIEFLAPYFRDPRYIRVNGRPLLLVYRVSKLPDPPGTVNRWRTWCRENDIGEIHLVSVCHGEVYPHVRLEEIGFDAYAAFPPHSFPCQHIPEDKGLFEGGYRLDYASGVDAFAPVHADTRLYEGCTLGWDNTARFGNRNVTMYLNFSLEKYDQWLRRVIGYTRDRFPEDERLIFINAWNEWAEGAYLEPDRRYGYAYLNTTARALFGLPPAGGQRACGAGEDRDSAARYTQDYEYLKHVIESDGENSLAKAAGFIEKDRAEVLEFGSAAGYFTRYLVEERSATVDIVEVDRDCAARAAAYARDCCLGDIEQYAWWEAFSGRRYDYILFADVLEHLRDPWGVLKKSAELLKPDGRVIVSVPNIAHAQILASLYNNDFSYADVGIMDKTHLRFFTEPTLRDMVREAGLAVCGLSPVRMPVLPQGCGTRWNRTKVPAGLRKMLAAKEHAQAIQFVVSCRRPDGPAA